MQSLDQPDQRKPSGLDLLVAWVQFKSESSAGSLDFRVNGRFYFNELSRTSVLALSDRWRINNDLVGADRTTVLDALPDVERSNFLLTPSQMDQREWGDVNHDDQLAIIERRRIDREEQRREEANLASGTATARIPTPVAKAAAIAPEHRRHADRERRRLAWAWVRLAAGIVGLAALVGFVGHGYVSGLGQVEVPVTGLTPSTVHHSDDGSTCGGLVSDRLEECIDSLIATIESAERLYQEQREVERSRTERFP